MKNKHPFPIEGLVYFFDDPTKKSVYIGHATTDSRKKDHENEGRILIAALPGSGQSIGSIEKSLHGAFSKSPIKVANSESHFRADKVKPYIEKLLRLNFASANWDEAKNYPMLPWKMIDPTIVLGEYSSFYHFGLMVGLGEKKGDGWQTRQPIIAAARHALGGTIDLDPASSIEANKRVGATTFFTRETNGLAYPWWGNVFLNPPYSTKLLSKFIDHLIKEYTEERVSSAVTVTNLQSFVSESSGQKIQKYASMHAILNGRPEFIPPDMKNKNGEQITKGSPAHGTICSFFGEQPELFKEAFQALGAFLCKKVKYTTINMELRRRLIRIDNALEIDRNKT